MIILYHLIILLSNLSHFFTFIARVDVMLFTMQIDSVIPSRPVRVIDNPRPGRFWQMEKVKRKSKETGEGKLRRSENLQGLSFFFEIVGEIEELVFPQGVDLAP